MGAAGCQVALSPCSVPGTMVRGRATRHGLRPGGHGQGGTRQRSVLKGEGYSELPILAPLTCSPLRSQVLIGCR